MLLAKSPTSYLNRNLWKRIRGRVDRLLRKSTKDAFKDQAYLFREMPVRTIFDVGANIGYVSRLYRHTFTDAQVYAFEPNPKVFEVLQGEMQRDRNIHAYPYAVSSQNGDVTFLVNQKSGSSSLFRPTDANRKRFHLSEPEPITVRAVSLDSFCQQEKIPEIDILKLDMEGAEIMALEGAMQLLSEAKIKVVYTEVSVVAMYENHQLFHHIAAYMEQAGYHLFNLYGFGETPIRQAFLGDAIFISSSLRQQLQERWGEAACGW
jgi:FkbM family methyltransferase